MKKGIFLLAVIALLSAAWSGVWYYATGKVETVIADTKTRFAEKGREFECNNQKIDGYPFRISINCDSVRYSDSATGLNIEAGKMRTAAQAYQPNKAIVELTSPAKLQIPSGQAFQTQWTSMRSSLQLGLSGPETLSLHGQEVNLVPESNSAQQMQIADMQIHGRQVGENNINLAINLEEVQSQSNQWPAFNLTSTFLLQDSYSDIINRSSLLRIAKSKGLKGNIQQFQYRPTQGGVLEITGPAEVSPQGFLTGKFDVTVKELPKLLEALNQVLPEERQKIADASNAVSLLSKRTGKDEITVPITVREGRISIGIIPLGQMKPLF